MDYIKPFTKLGILIAVGLFLSNALYTNASFVDNEHFNSANQLLAEMLEEGSPGFQADGFEDGTETQALFYIIVSAEAANVRHLPSLQGQVVSQVLRDERYPVYKEEYDQDGRLWFEIYIENEDRYAWISEKVTERE
ncbi:TPA: hypothetical protein G9C53_004901 [Salmonella enterica subsp. enterica serovar Typhimurium var. 5-]|uniref:SH3 domain-containing protein n=1 Tax=Salmonella enterica subsp. enterica serovar Typhimurium var. 5- TaxID=1620419 RepID=A0A740PM93_SALTM|nr:hypothetical protein [Salmonella enterica subsp. enterica serovar Typhimurium var. 5-]